MVISPVKLWRRQKKTAVLIGKKGKILTYSLIRVAPKDFIEQAPYPVVIVKLDDGENMIGQLVDFEKEELKIGRKVIAVLRRIRTENKEEVIPYSIKFKPL